MHRPPGFGVREIPPADAHPPRPRGRHRASSRIGGPVRRWCAVATRRPCSTRRCCPTSWSCCRRSPSRRASPSAGCSRRTATGTTCSAGSPSRGRARRRGRTAAGARAPRRAQRELRDFDERHYLERPAPLALGSSTHCRCPAARDRRRGARAARGRRPHRRRDGGWIGRGRGARLRRLPLGGETRRSRAGWMTIWRRWRAWSRSRRGDARGARPRRTDRRRSAASVLAEDRAYLEALRGGDAKLPAGRRNAEERRLHATKWRPRPGAQGVAGARPATTRLFWLGEGSGMQTRRCNRQRTQDRRAGGGAVEHGAGVPGQ